MSDSSACARDARVAQILFAMPPSHIARSSLTVPTVRHSVQSQCSSTCAQVPLTRAHDMKTKQRCLDTGAGSGRPDAKSASSDLFVRTQDAKISDTGVIEQERRAVRHLYNNIDAGNG